MARHGCLAIGLGALLALHSVGCGTDSDGGSGGGGGGPTCPDDPADGPVDPECGIWVSVSLGNDANPGTQSAPVATLQQAVDLAESGPGRVYACGGESWVETPVVPGSVSVHGGFDCTAGWGWVGWDTPSMIVPQAPLGMMWIDGGPDDKPLMTDLHVEAADATEPGGSSVAVFIRDDVQLTIDRCILIAGNGADGADGAPGGDTPADAGTEGNDGQGACTAAVTKGGASPGFACSSGTSKGGAGGESASGTAGAGEPGEPSSGPGGEGGLGGVVCTPGQVGAPGAGGEPGPAGKIAGLVTPSGVETYRGGDGAPGAPGQGGGGGGASPGSVAVCGAATPGGAAGGSGGGGGCGGLGGAGGQGGGNSIVIVTRTKPAFTLRDHVAVSGNGGDGGNGGPPQEGGLGGPPGIGGPGAGAINSGCAGGAGGKGGQGGWGGGGSGGSTALMGFPPPGGGAVIDGNGKWTSGELGQRGMGDPTNAKTWGLLGICASMLPLDQAL